MVLTRRASRLERERTEALALCADFESKVGLTDRDLSPSLLRPTPVPRTPEPEVPATLVVVKKEPVEVEYVHAQDALKQGAVHDELFDTITTPELSTPSSSGPGSLSPPEIKVKQEPDLSEGEEEEPLDTLGSLGLGRPGGLTGRSHCRAGRRVSVGSVTTVEDAEVSIDEFLNDREEFTSDEENKLRLWQSLCIEFGLVQLEIDPVPTFADLSVSTSPTDRPMTPPLPSTLTDRPITPPLPSTSSVNRPITPPLPSTSPIERPTTPPLPELKPAPVPKGNLPPIPTTCDEASALLKTRAHINIVDYYAARALPLKPGEERNYKDLLWESREAVVLYTRATGRFASKVDVKEEWLQPLMKRMRPFRRG